jgi:hypothetical protein
VSLVDDLEALRIAPADFGHARHVEAAWCYLQTFPAAEARRRFGAALVRFATHAGVPGKYDEALTLGWMDAIEACLAPGETFVAFAARNPSLLDKTSVTHRQPR